MNLKEVEQYSAIVLVSSPQTIPSCRPEMYWHCFIRWYNWWNCVLYDKNMKFGTHLGHVIQKIVHYRAMADIPYVGNGSLSSKWLQLVRVFIRIISCSQLSWIMILIANLYLYCLMALEGSSRWDSTHLWAFSPYAWLMLPMHGWCCPSFFFVAAPNNFSYSPGDALVSLSPSTVLNVLNWPL